MKVLTAYNKQHEQFLQDCSASIPTGAEHLVQFDEGKGKAWAMNQLLKRVDDNDIVVFCDADDMLMPLQESKFLLLRYDLVYGNAYEMDQLGNVTLRRSQPFDLELFKKQNFIPYSGVMTWGWLAKKVAYPDYFPVEDWIWWHQLYQHSGKFGYSGCVHSKRRVWTSNVARNVPVYSKITRLIRNYKAKQIIKSIYESKGNTNK
jgi:glycosyltransferase involved in cell wall biosynthesis